MILSKKNATKVLTPPKYLDKEKKKKKTPFCETIYIWRVPLCVAFVRTMSYK